MIARSTSKLFKFVETAEEAWAFFAAEYGFDLPDTTTASSRLRHP